MHTDVKLRVKSSPIRAFRWRNYIERRADVLCGKPVFKGTRLSVEFILDRMAGGFTGADLLNSFPTLKPEYIRAALACAAEVLGMDSPILGGPQSRD